MGMTMYTFAWKLEYLRQHLPDSTEGEAAKRSIDFACHGKYGLDEVTIKFPDNTVVTVAETMARIGGLPSNATYRGATA